MALSKVTVGGEVSGRNVALNARTMATDVNSDIVDAGNDAYNWYSWMDTPANFILSDMIHIADMKSSVEVLEGAKLTAQKDLSVNATTDFTASAKSIFETLAFNYTDLDVVTEAIVHSGSSIEAENLNVTSLTNVQLSISAVATNMLEMAFDVFDKSLFHGGAYAVSVSLLDVSNRAVIEKEVTLNVAKNRLMPRCFVRTICQLNRVGFRL